MLKGTLSISMLMLGEGVSTSLEGIHYTAGENIWWPFLIWPISSLGIWVMNLHLEKFLDQISSGYFKRHIWKMLCPNCSMKMVFLSGGTEGLVQISKHDLVTLFLLFFRRALPLQPDNVIGLSWYNRLVTFFIICYS